MKFMVLRCGIVGLGRIGCGFDDAPNKKSINTHAGAYSVHKNTKLVSLCDIDQTKLSKYGNKYNVSELFSDYKEMFQRSRLDCVSICTLADSHFEIVKEAAKHGIRGIFLEKPISDSLKSATEIVKICKNNDIKLQIDFQRRFNPFYHAVREILKNKQFGKVQHCSIYYGAGIANTGSHLFDLIRFLFGDISSIKGIHSHNTSSKLSDPNIDVEISLKNGIHCLMYGIDVSNYGILEMNILGSKERLRLDLAKSAGEYFQVSNNSGLVYKELESKPIKVQNKQDAIVLGLDNLVRAISSGVNLICTGNDGYFSLEGVIASMRSAKKNQRIHLPLKANASKISSK